MRLSAHGIDFRVGCRCNANSCATRRLAKSGTSLERDALHGRRQESKEAKEAKEAAGGRKVDQVRPDNGPTSQLGTLEKGVLGARTQGTPVQRP